jgi:hypothetical protein
MKWHRSGSEVFGRDSYAVQVAVWLEIQFDGIATNSIPNVFRTRSLALIHARSVRMLTPTDSLNGEVGFQATGEPM